MCTATFSGFFKQKTNRVELSDQLHFECHTLATRHKLVR